MLGFRERPNRSGQAYSLVLLSPIVPGAEDEVRRRLAALPTGPHSPFAAVPGTHFARAAIIDRLNHEGPGRRRQLLAREYLLFASVFDSVRRRPAERYLDLLCAHLPAEIAGTWGLCDDFPGAAGRDQIVAWMRAHQLHTGYFFAPYGGATLADVRRSLDLRERVRDFAVRMQREHPERVQAAFEAELEPLL